MSKKTMAVGELAKRIKAGLTDALLMDALLGKTVDGDTLVDAEEAISEAIEEFNRAHPVRISVTADDPSDEDKRRGFLRCTLRTSRPTLGDDAGVSGDE